MRAIRLQTDPKRTALYLHVPLPDRGLAVQGQALPNLPGSVRAVFATRKEIPVQAIRSDLVEEGRHPWVVEGSQSLRFTVAKDAGLSLIVEVTGPAARDSTTERGRDGHESVDGRIGMPLVGAFPGF